MIVERLVDEDGPVIAAHASKQSKISFKVFEAHTSAMIPVLLLPVFPFLITLKFVAVSFFALVLLERRGWTLGVAYKRLRTRLAGKYRYRSTTRAILRRHKIN
jgi:hypothetical protein